MRTFFGALVAALVFLGALGWLLWQPSADDYAGEVILYRKGALKTSEVRRAGPTCWAAWYKRIEKLSLRGDGTASDGFWDYRWTLNRRGPDNPTADREWFAKNCHEPPA